MWYVYDSKTFEIRGIGDTLEEARMDYANRYFVPADLGADSWDAVDWSAWEPEGMDTATHEHLCDMIVNNREE